MKTRTEQNGFVLVLVLCMVVLLGILLFGFNHKSRAELLVVDDLRKSEQALNCARAGFNIAIAVIRQNEDIHADKKLRRLLSGEDTFNIAEGKCMVTVTEESSKLNVNLLKNKNGEPDRTRIDQLLRLIDLLNRKLEDDSYISYELIPSIIDWIDADDEVTFLPFIKNGNLGAESDYYSNLAEPYRCKNKPLETTEELLLIKGITPLVFSCLRDYVTVKGDGKVNINYAPKYVIQSLSGNMDPVLVKMIINRRQIEPFSSIEQLCDIPGMKDSIYEKIKDSATVSSEEQYYQVTSQGSFDGLSRKIVSVLGKNTEAENIDVMVYKEL